MGRCSQKRKEERDEKEVHVRVDTMIGPALEIGRKMELTVKSSFLQ